MPSVDFGLAGIGVVLGEDQRVAAAAGDHVDDPERVIRWGYDTFHRAGRGDRHRYGHLGHADVGEGDLVALCGTSTGMRWCCTLVRI